MIKLTGLRKFERDLKRFSELTDTRFGKVRDLVAFEFHTRFVEGSPRDTGRFAASWNISFGSIDYSVQAPGEYPKPVVSLETNSNNYESVWITNGLPYAIPLEVGHSSQAPQGIVALNVLAVKNSFGRILKDAKR